MPRDGGEEEIHVYLLAQRAQLAALFRDFERAEIWLEQARSLDGEHPWLAVAATVVSLGFLITGWIVFILE